MAKLTEIVTFRLTKEAYENLKEKAKKECRSINGHVQWIINQYIKEKENDYNKNEATKK